MMKNYPDLQTPSLIFAIFCLLFSIFVFCVVSGRAQCVPNAYQKLSPGEKSRVWRFKLQKAIDFGEFSADQRDVLLTLHDFADEGLFVWASAGLQNTLIGERAAELELRTKNAFTKRELKLIFADEMPVSSVFRPVSLTPNCNCSVGSYFNMSCEGKCSSSGASCAGLADGCGFLGLYACDAYCSTGYVPEDPPQN